MYGTYSYKVPDKYDTIAKLVRSRCKPDTKQVRSRYEPGIKQARSRHYQKVNNNKSGDQKPYSLQRIVVPCFEPVIIKHRKRLLYKKFIGSLGLGSAFFFTGGLINIINYFLILVHHTQR